MDRGGVGGGAGSEPDQDPPETLPGRGKQEDRAGVRGHRAETHRHAARPGGQALEHHQTL